MAAVLSAGAAVAAVWHAARTFRRSAELQAFLTLTDRYEAIMSGIPARARVADDWTDDVDADLSLRLRYLNLCSEELYLRDCGLLSNVVWDIWEADMRSTLASAPTCGRGPRWRRSSGATRRSWPWSNPRSTITGPPTAEGFASRFPRVRPCRSPSPTTTGPWATPPLTS